MAGCETRMMTKAKKAIRASVTPPIAAIRVGPRRVKISRDPFTGRTAKPLTPLLRASVGKNFPVLS